MKPAENIHFILIAVLVTIIGILALSLVSEVLQPKGRVSCADFGSYEDALDAYEKGATWLSRPDKSGYDNHIPCESLLPRGAAVES